MSARRRPSPSIVISLLALFLAITGAAAASVQVSNASLSTQVSQLRALLRGVSRDHNTLVLSGVNVQLTDGLGAHSRKVNGLGNLIIGYNQAPGRQTGSGNLVLGRGQSFTSYGGIVAGADNAIRAAYASVLGGSHNTASGQSSTISGGTRGTAKALDSSVAGGEANYAGGPASTIVGGFKGFAHGVDALIAGGSGNIADGAASAVLGGLHNWAVRTSSSLVGGWANIANENYSAIVGGCANITGAGNAKDPGCGSTAVFDAMLGGYDNHAAGGTGSIVAGGNHNATTSFNSTEIGGYNNRTAKYGSETQFGGADEVLQTQQDGIGVGADIVFQP